MNSKPPSTAAVFGKKFSALLFDMDGTIISSIVATERVWGAWARRHGLDPVTFLPTIHGVRAFDTISRLGLPGVDAKHEAAEVAKAEIADVEGIVPIPGALAFLNSLPRERWAIVTSAPVELAKRRLEAAGMPLPSVLVTGRDVTRGKPNPAGYLLAAEKLGVRATDCLVFEDVTAGILAGEAAGADLLVVTATHAHPLETAHPTIADYENIEARIGEDGWISLAERAG